MAVYSRGKYSDILMFSMTRPEFEKYYIIKPIIPSEHMFCSIFNTILLQFLYYDNPLYKKIKQAGATPGSYSIPSISICIAINSSTL